MTRSEKYTQIKQLNQSLSSTEQNILIKELHRDCDYYNTLSDIKEIISISLMGFPLLLSIYSLWIDRNGIKFSDLGEEEKDILKDELIKINPDIFGDCYTVPKEIPLLRDLEEYSYILDACGKNKKFGLGLSIALGEREKALKTATDLQRKYRDQLVKGLEWIKKEGSVNLSHIQYLYSEDKVLKSVMGTIASIGLSINLLDDSKPVLGLSRLHKDIKVSGRTTRQQVENGVNLGKALQDSSNNFGGQGGGHDIAAGAMIPFDSKDNFLNLVNDMVEYQINND